MKYLRAHEIKEEGYYWWLPPYLEGNPHLDENWQVVYINPKANTRKGVFNGPLQSPIYEVKDATDS